MNKKQGDANVPTRVPSIVGEVFVVMSGMVSYCVIIRGGRSMDDVAIRVSEARKVDAVLLGVEYLFPPACQNYLSNADHTQLAGHSTD